MRDTFVKQTLPPQVQGVIGTYEKKVAELAEAAGEDRPAKIDFKDLARASVMLAGPRGENMQTLQEVNAAKRAIKAGAPEYINDDLLNSFASDVVNAIREKGVAVEY